MTLHIKFHMLFYEDFYLMITTLYLFIKIENNKKVIYSYTIFLHKMLNLILKKCLWL